MAASQVRRCYRSPRVTPAGREIATRLRVRYAPDGTLSGIPEIVSQSGVTPENRAYADIMAQAALASVIRCTPVSLPPELYTRAGTSST